jgi:hypothetical protein
VHFSRCSECDGRSGHNGAFNNGIGSKSDGGSGQNGAFNNGTGSKDDGGSGHNGAFKNHIRSNGEGSAESPCDVLRFGPVSQDNPGARTHKHGGVSLEEKNSVRIALSIQSDSGTSYN